jgi:hypothetical protein
MTNDYSADAAAFSAFRCRPESGFSRAIGLMCFSREKTAAFFAEFSQK